MADLLPVALLAALVAVQVFVDRGPDGRCSTRRAPRRTGRGVRGACCCGAVPRRGLRAALTAALAAALLCPSSSGTTRRSPDELRPDGGPGADGCGQEVGDSPCAQHGPLAPGTPTSGAEGGQFTLTALQAAATAFASVEPPAPYRSRGGVERRRAGLRVGRARGHVDRQRAEPDLLRRVPADAGHRRAVAGRGAVRDAVDGLGAGALGQQVEEVVADPRRVVHVEVLGVGAASSSASCRPRSGCPSGGSPACCARSNSSPIR